MNSNDLDDERAAFELDEHTIDECLASTKTPHDFAKAVIQAWKARAASLQATATQPAQTERALTDEQREAIEYGADCIHEKWGETMKAEVTLRALLTAAQPESGGDHD